MLIDQNLYASAEDVVDRQQCRPALAKLIINHGGRIEGIWTVPGKQSVAGGRFSTLLSPQAIERIPFCISDSSIASARDEDVVKTTRRISQSNNVSSRIEAGILSLCARMCSVVLNDKVNRVPVDSELNRLAGP